MLNARSKELFRPPDFSREGLKFYPWTSFLSIRRAKQPHRGRPSNVFRRYVRRSTIGIVISLTPPLIFSGGQTVRNLVSFKTSLNFKPPTFENAARHPNSETKVQCRDDRPMCWPSLVKLGPPTPEKAVSSDPPPKIACEKCAKSLITQPCIIPSRSNFAQSLNAWHPKCLKVQGQEVKCQGHSLT